VIRSTRWSHRRDDRGAAAVEMALVLPFLLLLLFGIIDFGLMLNAQQTVTAAAREGARTYVFTEDEDEAKARVALASDGLDGTVNATVTPCTDGQVTVVTTYAYSFITPLAGIAALFGGGLDTTITLKGKGVMSCAS
jgi:Flp pilus assembly protein TadG